MQGKDQVPQIHSTGTDDLAFAAEHAFPDLGFQIMYFSPSEKCMYQTDIKIGEVSGGAGGGTTSARNTLIGRRLIIFQVIEYTALIPVVIDLAVMQRGIAEVFHTINVEYSDKQKFARQPPVRQRWS